jgi:hypothetical protein
VKLKTSAKERQKKLYSAPFFHYINHFVKLPIFHINTYEVCSESNAPGEITSTQIILKARLFQDFLRPAHFQFGRIIRSSPSTA